MIIDEVKIAVIGLGYVGLPLAVEFGKLRSVVGFDVNQSRLDELRAGVDSTKETNREELAEAKNLTFTGNTADLAGCNFYIVTVPTPVNADKIPDLSMLVSASTLVGGVLKKGDIVVYESTVYPGATEEVCVPILEKCSKLTFNEDFFCGYSPERINPGDKEHTLTKIVKVTSGSNEACAALVDDLYSEIITVGTYKAESIKIAEAAKVIENTQRDLNIALMNELSKIFHKMDLDTEAVLIAAGTKWNFLPFKPGLVGGHCIGVDPYYLTHKSTELGYKPEIILAGRQLNDNMSSYVASTMVSMLAEQGQHNQVNRVLILGLTFKENCPDTRNSKVFDLVEAFPNDHYEIHVYDPWVNRAALSGQSTINLIDELAENCYRGIILAVPHDCLVELGIEEIKSKGKDGALFFDLKSAFDKKASDFRL
ncbi:nucleotide sugar dehydrogenase [Planktomarina temperata]|nr:nucleotide sugar dehydrogenase [Planktomarina temperata]